jgi:GYF domain 2/RDD family
MAICKSCGNKYSRWTVPVSARGVCAECFWSEWEKRESEAEPSEHEVDSNVAAVWKGVLSNARRTSAPAGAPDEKQDAPKGSALETSDPTRHDDLTTAARRQPPGASPPARVTLDRRPSAPERNLPEPSAIPSSPPTSPQLYYTYRNGQQAGPYTFAQVRSMWRVGSLDAATLYFTAGMTEWKPLLDLAPDLDDPALSSPPRRQSNAEERARRLASVPSQSVNQVRPWVRYWARLIDNYLFMICGEFVLDIIAPGALIRVNALLLWCLVLLFLWCFIEAWFLSTWGATPGKALLRVSVRNADGSVLGYFEALTRSFDVWFRGLGMGLPLVGLIPMVVGYDILTKRGITPWDRSANTQVTHRTIGPVRIIVAILLLVFAFFVFSLRKVAW